MGPFDRVLAHPFAVQGAEETSVTIDTAMRLARALGTTAEFWLNLQAHHDLLVTDAADINEIEPLLAA